MPVESVGEHATERLDLLLVDGPHRGLDHLGGQLQSSVVGGGDVGESVEPADLFGSRLQDADTVLLAVRSGTTPNLTSAANRGAATPALGVPVIAKSTARAVMSATCFADQWACPPLIPECCDERSRRASPKPWQRSAV